MLAGSIALAAGVDGRSSSRATKAPARPGQQRRGADRERATEYGEALGGASACPADDETISFLNILCSFRAL